MCCFTCSCTKGMLHFSLYWQIAFNIIWRSNKIKSLCYRFIILLHVMNLSMVKVWFIKMVGLLKLSTFCSGGGADGRMDVNGGTMVY